MNTRIVGSAGGLSHNAIVCPLIRATGNGEGDNTARNHRQIGENGPRSQVGAAGEFVGAVGVGWFETNDKVGTAEGDGADGIGERGSAGTSDQSNPVGGDIKGACAALREQGPQRRTD